MAERISDKEQFWRRILAQFDPHRESIRAFCRRLGVGEHSFYWWRRELRQRPQGKPAVFEVVDVTPTTGAEDMPIEVRLRGQRVLRVRAGFDADLLRQLVLLLEAIPQAKADPC
jgi:transposase-like protein